MSKMNVTKKALLISSVACSLSIAAEASTNSEVIKPKKASTFPKTVNKPVPGEIIVKCAGIVKKGRNHCGANGHTCSGQATTDFDRNEWIYVRKDVCEATPGKIVGKKRVVKG